MSVTLQLMVVINCAIIQLDLITVIVALVTDLTLLMREYVMVIIMINAKLPISW